jgi:hypothetical protein
VDDDAALNELEDGQADDDEEPDEEDTDEIDPSVEASDNAMVDEVAAELDTETLPSLTREEINLGRFSLSKVLFNLIHSSHATDCLLISFETSPSVFLIAQQFAQTLNFNARLSKSSPFLWFETYQRDGTALLLWLNGHFSCGRHLSFL